MGANNNTNAGNRGADTDDDIRAGQLHDDDSSANNSLLDQSQDDDNSFVPDECLSLNVSKFTIYTNRKKSSLSE